MTSKDEGEISLWDKVKIRFSGTRGGKIAFITTTSILFLLHSYYYLKVSFYHSILAYILCMMTFVMIWYFGCPIHESELS